MKDHGPSAVLPGRPAQSDPAHASIALVGGCHDGVPIPADELAAFYRGYGWMAKAVTVVALLWGTVLALAQYMS